MEKTKLILKKRSVSVLTNGSLSQIKGGSQMDCAPVQQQETNNAVCFDPNDEGVTIIDIRKVKKIEHLVKRNAGTAHK
ncbi:MAG: hypothetical protein RLZZ292_2349 [Bacteroidota bacterium]|jgi:hypothetical protein